MQTHPAWHLPPALRNADRLASAVARWVRQQSLQQRFAGVVLASQDEHAMAAGFLTGLRDALCLEDSEVVLIAYAYQLKRGGLSPVDTALLLSPRNIAAYCRSAGYRSGRQAARVIIDENAALPT